MNDEYTRKKYMETLNGIYIHEFFDTQMHSSGAQCMKFKEIYLDAMMMALAE